MHNGLDAFTLAAQLVNQTRRHLFITGKAGTGKTTFLKQIKDNTIKNAVVVAPTGVAAINAGGSTIHSFFQLPFTPFLSLPDLHTEEEDVSNKHTLFINQRMTKERRDILQKLDLLIIDEISMVRCDVLDAIDTVLRNIRNNYRMPFGGVQVIYIGDLFQLPPVVQDHEWNILQTQYESPFFFHSKVIAETEPLTIEFEKVYRQEEGVFLDILNELRNNNLSRHSFEILKSREIAGHHTLPEGVITLTTHNVKADRINDKKLSELPGKAYSFEAEITGEFYESNYPMDKVLWLKEGAQVMFVKNDVGELRQYYNGKIGKVLQFEDERIIVESDGREIEVRKDTWKNIKYTLNRVTGRVEEEETGTFTQFPLRLAWAITIHKSQGLTFDKVAIDAVHSFSAGQTYVALSRCRSLDGIHLLSQISTRQLNTSGSIVSFMERKTKTSKLEAELANGLQFSQRAELEEMFSFDDILRQYKRSFAALEQISKNESLDKWVSQADELMNGISQTSEKFLSQFPAYFMQEHLPFNNRDFVTRLNAAAEWFISKMKVIQSLIKNQPVISDNRTLAMPAEEKLQQLYNSIGLKVALMQQLGYPVKQEALLEVKRNFRPELHPVRISAPQSAPTDVKYPELFEALIDWRRNITETTGAPVYLICTVQSIKEICNRLPLTESQLKQISGFGAIKVRQYGNEILDIVNSFVSMSIIEVPQESFSVPVLKKEKKVKEKTIKPDTRQLTYELWKSGKKIADIASERNLTIGTIAGHFQQLITSGKIQPGELLTAEKIHLAEKVLARINGEVNYNSVKNALNGEIELYEVMWLTASKKSKV